MKKLYLVSVLMFGLLSAYCQTQITLTFTGKDSISQNTEALDYVMVKNLVWGCDTLLEGPFPVLSLSANWPVGLHETDSDSPGAFVLKQNWPNPFQGLTTVSIHQEHKGQMNLMLINGMGTKLAKYHHWLNEGFHSFVITSPGNKVLFLVVSDSKNSCSIKMVSTGQSSETSSIRYLEPAHPVVKSTALNQYNSGFVYTLGDQLIYTAHRNGTHETTVFDKPMASTAYILTMVPINLIAIPTVVTANVIPINPTEAQSGGTVTSDGGAPVTARGVCWSMSLNPTLADSHTTDGTGIGTYISYMTGLIWNATYHVRAYATNSAGTSYGNEWIYSWF
jgi:hypothetical protein